MNLLPFYRLPSTVYCLRFLGSLDATEAWWRQVDGSSRFRWEPIDMARAEKAHSPFFR